MSAPSWLTEATAHVRAGDHEAASAILASEVDAFGTAVAVAVLREAAARTGDPADRACVLGWLALRADPADAREAATRAVRDAPPELRARLARVVHVTGGDASTPCGGDDPEGRLLDAWGDLAEAADAASAAAALRRIDAATAAHPCAEAPWIAALTRRCAAYGGLTELARGASPAWIFAPSERVVHTGGGALRFSRAKLQYALLEHIATSPDAEARDLFENVWSQRFRPPSSTNTLHVTVKRLRDRLDDPGRLVARAGGGYALEPRPAVYVWGTAAPRPRTSRRAPPPTTDRFVGRQADLARLRELLADHSVVTVVGPGGIGKTRLAVELARAADTPVDFVSLVGAHTAPDVLRCIRPGVPDPDRGLAGVLPDDGWVVLDNAERVAGPLATLVDGWTPTAVRLLITSREPLRARGEAVLRLGPLSRDDATLLLAIRSVAEQGEGLGQIADSVGCHPLALEMVASRLSSLPLADLQSGLERHRLDLMAGGRRGAPPRHRSMRANLDASWALLSGDETDALCAAATFGGAFDAGQVAALLDRPGAASDIYALVDKSLIAAGPGGLRLRPVVVAHARERMGDARWTALCEAHATWALQNPQAVGELRAVLARSVPAVVQARAILTLARWLHYAALPSEICATVLPVLERLPADEANLRCQLHLMASLALTNLRDGRAARVHAEQAAVIAQEADDPEMYAIALYYQTEALAHGAGPEAVRRLANRCLDAALALPASMRSGSLLNNIAQILQRVGADSAIRAYEAAAASLGAVGSPYRAMVLLNLGIAWLMRGELTEAERALADARAAPTVQSDPAAVGSCELLDGMTMMIRGDPDAAARSFRRSWEAYQRASHRFATHNSRQYVGEALLEAGRDVAARAVWEDDAGMPEGAVRAQLVMQRIRMEGRAALASGDRAAARAAVEVAERQLATTVDTLSTTLERGFASGLLQLRRNHGLLRAMEGDLAGARRLLTDARDPCARFFDAETLAWRSLVSAAAGSDPGPDITLATGLAPEGTAVGAAVRSITVAASDLAAGRAPVPPTGTSTTDRILRHLLAAMPRRSRRDVSDT